MKWNTDRFLRSREDADLLEAIEDHINTREARRVREDDREPIPIEEILQDLDGQAEREKYFRSEPPEQGCTFAPLALTHGIDGRFSAGGFPKSGQPVHTADGMDASRNEEQTPLHAFSDGN